MTHTLRNRLISILAATLLVPAAAWAAKDPTFTRSQTNVAVDGYDVTSYFAADAEAPIKGSDAYSTEYQGAEWHFASQENLDKFVAAPEQYAPQYGGYCAYAVAKNSTAKGEPLLWTLHDGKLYLNYNAKINKKWNKKKEGYITDADENWPKVLN